MRCDTKGVDPAVVAALQDNSGAWVLDLGVYTKNRNFRVAYSTKQGKQVPLVLRKLGLLVTVGSTWRRGFRCCAMSCRMQLPTLLLAKPPTRARARRKAAT